MRNVLLAIAFLASGCLDPVAFEETPSQQVLLATDALSEDLEVVQYHMPGMQPDAATTAALAERLTELTSKASVTFAPSVELQIPSRERWDVEALFGLAESLGVDFVPKGPVVTAFHLSGRYETDNVTAAGVQILGVVATFPETMRVELPGGVLPHVPIDDHYAVFLHELGHALGLVDNGVPMVRSHIDPRDPCDCHSANPRSVMYSRVDSTEYLVAQLQEAGEIPDEFDADDVADIQAFQRANGANVGR